MSWVKQWTAGSRSLWATIGWEGRIGAISLAVIGLLVLAGPFISPYDSGDIVSSVSYAPVGDGAILGTDYLGRDVFSRMLHGGRVTIGLALIATVSGCLAGVMLGFLASLFGGAVDSMAAAFIDLLLSLPPILFALVILAGLGPSLTVLIFVVAVIHMSRVARIARALAAEIAAREFVDVARARGDSKLEIMAFEILPNAAQTLAIELALRFTFSILLLSALSFLGLGLQPPTADWGVMVRENLTGLRLGASAAILPAGAIAVLTLSINLLVDGMTRSDRGHLAREEVL